MRKHEFGLKRNRRDRNRRDRNRHDRNWHKAQHQPPPVVCDVQSYARFSRWLDGELAKLERRWRHTAAPAAREPLARAALGCPPSFRLQKPKPR